MSYRFYPLPSDGDGEVDRLVLPFEFDDLATSVNDDVSLDLDLMLSDYGLMDDDEPAASPLLPSTMCTPLPRVPNAWKARRGSCGSISSIGSAAASVAASTATVNTTDTSATASVFGATTSLTAVDDTDKWFASLMHDDCSPQRYHDAISAGKARDDQSLYEELLDGRQSSETLAVLPFDVFKATVVTDDDVLLRGNLRDDGLLTSLVNDDDATHPHHIGTRLFRDSFYKFHCRYARAKNALEKSSCCHAWIKSVSSRRGRFLIRQQRSNQEQLISDDSSTIWYEMGVADILAKADKDLTELCFVHDYSADRDFFLGRGGHCANYPGHKLLLDLRDELRETYSNVEGRSNSQRAIETKTRVAQELIDRFYARELKGRILKEHVLGSNQWYIADNQTALKAVKQKLCERRQVKSSGSTTSCSGSLGSLSCVSAVSSTSSIQTDIPSFVTTITDRLPRDKNDRREKLARACLRIPDVVVCYAADPVDTSISNSMTTGCASCRDHPGTLQYLSDLQLQHAKYTRAKNDAERVLLCREFLHSVWIRQGRFWVHAPGAETLRLMDTVGIEASLSSRLTQPCFVADVCKEKDVLLGHGDQYTNNEGSQRFLDQMVVLCPAYSAAFTDAEKTKIAQDLVDWVFADGGRILKEIHSSSNKWYMVENENALRRAESSLRLATVTATSSNQAHTNNTACPQSKNPTTSILGPNICASTAEDNSFYLAWNPGQYSPVSKMSLGHRCCFDHPGT